jgi:hypothetical protein
MVADLPADVSGNPPAEPGKPFDAPATDAQEVEAALLRDKAREAEDMGEVEKAIELYERAARVGRTSVQDESNAAADRLRGRITGSSRRSAVERAFLAGRLADLDSILSGARDPLEVYPLLLRDIAWRRMPGSIHLGTTIDARSHLGALYAWLASGGDAPIPLAEGGRDPYPVLTALVQDRRQRESLGLEGLPRASPLSSLRSDDPEIERLNWESLGVMAAAYGKAPPPPEERAAIAASHERAGEHKTRALWLVLVAVVLLVGSTLVIGRRVSGPLRA